MVRKRKLKFSDKKHSIKGTISLIISIISIILLLVMFYLSALSRGYGGMLLGIVGIFILIFSVVGFILAYQGYKEKDIYYHVPVAGIILNGIIFLGLFILYIVGLFL